MCAYWDCQLDEETRSIAWDRVMELGREIEHGVTHNLNMNDVETIVATANWFAEDYTQQVVFDLWRAKYKIYDWLAMLLDGRDDGHCAMTQVFTYAYLKANGHPKEMVRILRREDFEPRQPDLNEVL